MNIKLKSKCPKKKTEIKKGTVGRKLVMYKEGSLWEETEDEEGQNGKIKKSDRRACFQAFI